MDTDTIIYIIVTIVIFIVSLLGNNKKPKQLPQQEETDDIAYTLNEFEKILERKEEFAQEQEYQQDNIEIVQEEPQSELAEYHQKVEKEDKEKAAIQKKKEMLIEKETKKEPEDEDNEDGFDLNAAIIYSSILERKKFRH